MRVVVTGGSGRLGRSVLHALTERGHHVVNADLQPSGGVEFICADLRNAGDAYHAITYASAEALVHLAALTVPFQHLEQILLSTNVSTTFNVFQAAYDLGVRTVVNVGSPSAVGYGRTRCWAPRYLPIDEDHPLEPWHAYSLSKQLGEEFLRFFVRKDPGRMRAFTVRPCFVVTPEEWRDDIPMQDGKSIRDRLENPALASTTLFNYVDARDAAELIALLVEGAADVPNGAVFYAGAADALSREPLAELLPFYYPATAELASCLTGSTPAFCTAKATRLLGWQPRHSWRTEIR